MLITIKLFAYYRDLAGTSSFAIDVPVNTTVNDLCTEIRQKYDHFPKEDRSLLVAVNHEYADSNQILVEGDEVALIPPVSGGSK